MIDEVAEGFTTMTWDSCSLDVLIDILTKTRDIASKNGYSNLIISFEPSSTYDDSEVDVYITGDRAETEQERKSRLGYEKQRKEKDEKNKKAIEEMQRAQYEELKRKFESPKGQKK